MRIAGRARTSGRRGRRRSCGALLLGEYEPAALDSPLGCDQRIVRPEPHPGRRPWQSAQALVERYARSLIESHGAWAHFTRATSTTGSGCSRMHGRREGRVRSRRGPEGSCCGSASRRGMVVVVVPKVHAGLMLVRASPAGMRLDRSSRSDDAFVAAVDRDLSACRHPEGVVTKRDDRARDVL